MHWFYHPEIEGEILALNEAESHHVNHVLRMHAGELVRVTDGKGMVCEAAITEVHPRHTSLTIRSSKSVPPPLYRVHIAIAPPKSIDRFEWFMEKATETGVGKITPLLCERSERKNLNMARMEKILVSALKQSRQAWLPVIPGFTPFTELISSATETGRFIAHCNNTPDKHYLGRILSPLTDTLLLVGPEGDFSPEETARAIERGFIPVHLGPGILRTETAGLLGCHIIRVINELAAG